MTPDINVLVAAARADHVHHRVASAWLDHAIAACASGGTLAILPMVAAGFIRLVTNPRIFPVASTAHEAFAYINALLELPGVSMPALGREWPALQQLCTSQKLSGLAVPDAWIAAAATINGLHLVSFDRDFTKLLHRSQFTLLKP